MEILLDQNGYNEFMQELDNLKETLLKNALDGSESFRNDPGNGWHDNFLFEESMRNEKKISKQIEDMFEESKRLKIIKEIKTEDNIVKINDLITLEFNYPNGNKEIDALKITGKYKPNIDEETMVVTLNSPIGKAIYHKQIYDEIHYFVNDKNIVVHDNNCFCFGKFNSASKHLENFRSWSAFILCYLTPF